MPAITVSELHDCTLEYIEVPFLFVNTPPPHTDSLIVFHFCFSISDGDAKTTGRVGHMTKDLLLLNNNDLFTVQTRDEQDQRKAKVKHDPTVCVWRVVFVDEKEWYLNVFKCAVV
jgi:hypothetical protein